MVCMEEVFTWFKELKESPRIDFICEIFNFCSPYELRFLGTILEDLGKKDFSCMWEDEQRANSDSDVLRISDISDPVVRSQLIVTLVLLHSNNRLCAAKIFKVLLDELDKFDKFLFLAGDSRLNEVILLLTLAARHPAFSFEQKDILSQQRILLEKLSCQSPSRSAFSPQDIAIYANSNTFGSTFAPVPASTLQEAGDIEMVLSLYPALSTAVTPGTTTYLTTQPMSHTSSLNVLDSSLIQITGLEFSGIEKNRTYRIRATLSNGKQVELVKSAMDISTFHQKLLPSLSQGTQIGNSETIIPPFPPAFNGHNNFSHICFEDTTENKIQLSEYFRKLSGLLHLLDHNVLLDFIQCNAKPSPINSIYIDESDMLRSPGVGNLYQPGQYQTTNENVVMVQSINTLSNAPPLAETRISTSRPCMPLSSPTGSPLSSPVSSPLVSPPASETSSRSASPLQQVSKPNSSSQIRALRPKGSSVVRQASVGNNKFQTMSIENLENISLVKRHAGKPKKFDSSGMHKPNGVTYQQYQKLQPPSKSSHNQNQTPAINSYNFQTTRSRSESSHSFSDCSGSSSPLSDGSNGQVVQQSRHQTSSSSEENLDDHGSRGKRESVNVRSTIANSIVTYSNTSICHTSVGVISPLTATAIPLSKHNMESHIVSATPMISHPFKTNQIVRSSPGSQHFQMPVDNRLLQLNPTMHVIASNVPPPGLPRPAHLSPGNLPPSNDRNGSLNIPGMMPYNPGMTTALPYTTGNSSRSHAVLRNSCASVTTTSVHCGSANNHRYSPPKVHNQIDKGSVILPTNHPLPEFMPILLTQPPPPVHSSASGVVPISAACLSQHCNCTTSVSSTLGPIPPTNGGTVPATMPYTVGFLPPMFPPTFHFVTSHSSGGTPNSYIMPYGSYPIHNGVTSVGHELLFGHGIPLPVSVAVTSVANNTSSTPTVQQGVPGAPTATINGPLYPGMCPFPPLGNLTQPKIVSCHNCGVQGHKGQDCKESTADDIQKTNQFRINFNSTSKQPIDSHD